ncbi:hypothetical protein MVEN_02637400 [Mycena venus]|uniref:Uncharacterized protein n=1 Tax=Mycena venus TaxID=2733690 RepID=A0A8H6WTM9_9AGAR|nr:hypothetical protein MVEN_02637400 [Mycena venus]
MSENGSGTESVAAELGVGVEAETEAQRLNAGGYRPALGRGRERTETEIDADDSGLGPPTAPRPTIRSAGKRRKRKDKDGKRSKSEERERRERKERKKGQRRKRKKRKNLKARRNGANMVSYQRQTTLPDEKYYNMESYNRRMAALRQGEFLPPPEDSYDPQADLKAISGAHKKKVVEHESYLSREQLMELRRVQHERIEAGKMKQLGMDVKQNMGVRMDGTAFDD